MSTATADATADELGGTRASGRRSVRRYSAWALVLLFLLAGLAGLLIQLVPALRHLYLDQSLGESFLSPGSGGHALGTDQLGRDLGWRLLGGLGISLSVAVSVALISIVLGLVFGILAGFFGRVFDAVMNIFIDVTWAFPAILLAVVFAGIIGPGLVSIVLALALTNWASFARIVRGEVLSLREREYVSASRALGYRRLVIAGRHLVPNLVPVTMVMASYYMATAIVAEAGLSFIGLGAQAPTPSLGQIVAEGRNYLSTSIWPIVLSSVAIVLVVMAFNTLGDNLRDASDPRLAHVRR